jgi:hypothetical protein
MDLQYAPPGWTNQEMVLYHGTTAAAAREIAAGKIALHHGRRGVDFGPGFYTTTIEAQARRWAARRAGLSGRKAAVVEMLLRREEVASLQFMAFVDKDARAEQFWAFVHYCRSGATDHGRDLQGTSALGYYDVVFGPVAAYWNRSMEIGRADQVSFHTEEAVRLLNTKARRRMIQP